MRYVLYINLFFSFILGSHAQSTFQVRFNHDLISLDLHQVFETDSTFVTFGTAPDSSRATRGGLVITSFSKTGTILNRTDFFNEDYYLYGKEHSYVQEGNMVHIFSGGRDQLFFNYFATIDLLNPEEWVRFERYDPIPKGVPEGGVLQISESKFVCNYTMNELGETLGNTVVQCFGPSVQDTIWIKKFDHFADGDRSAKTLIYDKERGKIYSGEFGNPDSPLIYTPFRTSISCLDTLGNLLWEWESPSDELWHGVSDMVVLDDGSLIIGTALGEILYNGQIAYDGWQKMLVKLTPDREIAWRKLYPDDRSVPTDTYLNQVIRIPGENSLMLASNIAENIFDGIWRSFYYGWYQKITEDGEVLWTRRYTFDDRIDNGVLIRDLKPTQDGGFIAVGRGDDGDAWLHDRVEQAGYIIKLDEHGCLVPGCHISSTEEAESDPLQVKIYPNPTSEFLNVFVQSKTLDIDATELVVTNLLGQELSRQRLAFREGTYIIDVSGWQSGTYTVRLVTKGQVLRTKLVQKL